MGTRHAKGMRHMERVLVYNVMKGQLKASTPAEYIAKLEEPRKSEIATLDALIRRTAPKLAPFVHIGILAARVRTPIFDGRLKFLRSRL